ncbi:MAG: hypothetical protein ACRD4B_02155, partial [Acidobacteriota bacterium]
MAKDVHYTDPSRNTELPDYDPEAAADYVSKLEPIKERKAKSKRNKIILIVGLLLLAAGAAAYFLFLKSEKSENQAPQTTQQTQTEEQPQIVESEKYESTDLNLSFEYPTNWKIDDSTQGLLTVSSPVTKLTDVNGEQSDAKVVVTFLSSGSEVPAFEDGTSATAVMDSEKITYDSPSQSQREQTFISFAGFGSSGLDDVFVTGDSGYQKDQIIPEADIKKIEPIISVRFYSCSDAECTGEGAGQYTIELDEWSSN